MSGIWFKSFLTKIGRRLSEKTIHRLNAVINYLEVGRWMAARGFSVRRRVADRRETFERIAAQIGGERVLYLEFGVHQGGSIEIWSKLLTHPDSQLHGFDSFEGLPERWTLQEGAGYFSTGGAIPKSDDPRVRFIKGWFNETLPGYVLPPHDRLVVHLDADLYSSTKTVLDALEQHIVPGTYLLFDEFSDRWHELRAFDEFLATHPNWRFELVGADKILARVAFVRVA